MKLYKSLLFGLLMCGFAACDTTDLERDINSLKDRVEDYEAQVQKLNDDMNIIRVLLDGNKTITSYSFDGANYTLTLSNGETLTLTQGVVGANYPSITIGENGNWVIAGTDSGIRAEAKDGEDAPYTPQFKIENENWCVSLDGGATWQNLGVKATGTASGTSPISSVTPATDGNSIKITLAGGKTCTIPVVKDLVCEITEPKLADGEMWYIGCEATEKLKVKVNIQAGDIIRPVVPADWTANIVTPNYTSLSGEQTLEVEVTAPATASKCVVTMEVSRGVNTVTDEIVARTETTSYYDDFMAGLDIEIDGLKINKTMFTDATLVESNANIEDAKAYGLYFVKPGVTLTYSVSNSVSPKHLIVIGDEVNDNTACFKLSQRIQTNMTTSPTNIDGYYVWNNIKFDASALTSAVFIAYRKEAQDKRIIFDDCDMILPAKNFFELTGDGRYFNDFSLKNSRIKLSGDMFLVHLNENKSTDFGKLTIENNVFYTASIDQKVTNFKLVNAKSAEASLNTLIIKQNTFINVSPNWSGMYYTLKLDNVELQNNLFWNAVALAANGIILRPGNVPSSVVCANNVGFSLSNDGNFSWIAAYGGIDKWNASTEDITNLFSNSLEDENNPFHGGEMDFETGKFIPNAEYSLYGARQN